MCVSEGNSVAPCTFHQCYTMSLWILIPGHAFVYVVPTCEQLSDLHICGLPEQSDQGRDSSAVLEGDLVVIVGLAVDQVSEGSTGAAVHVSHPVVQ